MTEINEPASLADRLEDINHITQFDGLDALVATCTQAAAALRAMEEALSGLEYWFDTDEEILSAMSADERADNERQLGKIRAALATARETNDEVI